MDSSRPRFETVEVDSNQTPPPPVSSEQPPQSLPDNEPQIAKKGSLKHHIGKFVFLVPALLILGTIFAAAYFFNNQFRQYTEPTPAPTVAPTLAPATPEPTIPPEAKLNSYQAKKFSFDYSSELLLTECDNFIYLKAATNSAEINDNDCDAAAKDHVIYVQHTTKNPSINTSNTDQSELTVDNVEAKKYTSIAENEEYFEYVVFNQVLVDETAPTYFVVRNDSGSEYNDEFNKILETFKLIKIDPTETWETYEDTTYEFSFKYPSEWTLVPPPEKNKSTKNIVEIRKSANEFKLNTLHIEADLLESDPEVSAGEIIVSTRNLAGWVNKPPIEYRNIGGGTAQVLQGILEGKWYTFVIIWRKNVFIQMSWTDTLEKLEQETFNNMFSTFKFSN